MRLSGPPELVRKPTTQWTNTAPEVYPRGLAPARVSQSVKLIGPAKAVPFHGPANGIGADSDVSKSAKPLGKLRAGSHERRRSRLYWRPSPRESHPSLPSRQKSVS